MQNETYSGPITISGTIVARFPDRATGPTAGLLDRMPTAAPAELRPICVRGRETRAQPESPLVQYLALILRFVLSHYEQSTDQSLSFQTRVSVIDS